MQTTVDSPLAAGGTEQARPRFAAMVARVRSATGGWHKSVGLWTTLAYFLCSIAIWEALLLHPLSRAMAENYDDQNYFEWQFAWVQHALFHFQNPLFTHAMNAPVGVNVIADPQTLLPEAVLSPVTALAGAPVGYLLLMVVNLAATAAAWRWFLLRNVVSSQTAAFVGGLVCGFSPAMLTHSLGHPNLTVQWLIPVIVDRLLRLRSGERLVRDAIVLGVLLVVQLLSGEELLMIAAVTLAIYFLFYAVMAPARVREWWLPMLKGSGLAVAVAGVLAAYPLWFQFLGPRAVPGIPYPATDYSADLRSYGLIPTLSIAGPHKVGPLVQNDTEQAALLGPLLISVVIAAALWCVRSAAIRAAALCTGLLVLLSLGPEPKYHGHPLPAFLAPWKLIRSLPLIKDSLPMRMALAVCVLAALLLAAALDKAMADRRIPVRAAAVLVAVLGLVPLIPRTMASAPRPRVPAFVADGTWRTCTSGGRSLAVAPLDDPIHRVGMGWAVAAHAGFAIPQGYFFERDPKGTVVLAPAVPSQTALWLGAIDGTGKAPAVTADVRNRVQGDLRTWNAGCAVVDGADPHVNQFRTFFTAVLGPGKHSGGVWYWRVS